MAIRPEDVTVTAGPAAGTVLPGDAPPGNVLPVTVEVVEYHGREQAVEARLDGGARLRLRSTDRLAPGDRVQVRIAPERVLVYPGPST